MSADKEALIIQTELRNIGRGIVEDAAALANSKQKSHNIDQQALGLANKLLALTKEDLAIAGNAGELAKLKLKHSKQEAARTIEAASLSSQLAKDKLDNIAAHDAAMDKSGEIAIEIQEATEKGNTAKLHHYTRAQAANDKILDSLAERMGKDELIAVNMAAQSTLAASLADEMKKEEGYQKAIANAMGLSGEALGALGGLMGKLGINSGVVKNTVKEAKDAMFKMAEAPIRMEATIGKLPVMMKGLGVLAKGFGKALFDPLTIATLIFKKFTELEKLTVAVGRQTGQNVALSSAMNSELASAADIMGMMSEHTASTGINTAAIYSPDDLARMAEAKNLLGLSAKEAMGIGVLSKASGKTIEGTQKSIIAGVNGYNRQTGSVIAHGVILKDVLNTSEDVSMSLGGNPGKIAAAASAARGLGLDLARVNDVASGLLNFESSIEAEMEAQLMTGKNINLSKARELALNNDLEGVAKELKKNGASGAEFAAMNRLEQESLAKALGVTRQELGKMAVVELELEGATDKAKAAAMNMTIEQFQQMESSDALQKALGKITEPLGAILTNITPLITSFAKFIALISSSYIGQFVLVLGTLAVALRTTATGKLVLQAATWLYTTATTAATRAAISARIATLRQSIADKAAAVFRKIRTAATWLYNAATTTSTATTTLSTLATIREGIANKLSAVFQGAKTIALGLWNSVSITSISLGAAKLAQWIAQKAAMIGNTIATWAMVAVNWALGASNTVVGTTGAAAGAGAATAGAGLATFATLASAAIPVLLAIGAVVLMITPALWVIGEIIKTLATVIGDVLIKALEMLPGIIGSIATGFTTMLTAITDNLAAVFLIGPALMLVGAGLTVLAAGSVIMAAATPFLFVAAIGILALGAAMSVVTESFGQIGEILTAVTGLVAISGGMAVAGFGLASLGVGLGTLAVGVALLAPLLPALMTLNSLGILGGSSSIESTVASTGDGSNESSVLGEKLDTLIALVEKGGNVLLDGNKVGEVLALGNSRLS